MTYLQLRQRIAEIMGVSSADTTADANDTMQDKLKRWVNVRYKALAAKRSWNWLVKDSIVQTVVDITTGTVTATNGSANLVFTSAIVPSSVTGYFIQFSSTNDWYELTSTADTTHAVMTVPYLGTTSSTLTFVLRKVYYLLPTDTGKILDIRQSRVWNTKLRYIPARILDQYFAYRNQNSVRPLFYTIIGVDTTTRAYKMEIFPIPSAAMNLNVRRYSVVADLSADGDIPVIPEAYHDIIVWDVLKTYGFTFLDDTRLSSAKAEYNEMYADMIANDVATENTAVRMPYDVDLVGGDTGWLSLYNTPIV